MEGKECVKTIETSRYKGIKIVSIMYFGKILHLFKTNKEIRVSLNYQNVKDYISKRR